MTWYGLAKPTVVEMKRLSIARLLEIVMVDLPIVLGGCAFGASRARLLFSRLEAFRWVQRGTGVAMASAAVGVASR
jgi:threonine/homoserine/homoserine lactone efflux protein